MLWSTIGRLSVDRTNARVASASGPRGRVRMSFMTSPYGHRPSSDSGPKAVHRYHRAMASQRAHRVAVLVLPGVIPLELGTATQVFGRDPHYDLTVCAEGRLAPAPRSGLTI